MMIYRAALARSEAIDLWPQDYVENPADDLSLAPRIAKARAKVQLDTYIPRFRSQHDLQYVRKTMATGPPATCRQVYREAALLFWCENTFRFSGDYEWFGIRRFLATIGPQATSRIPKLEAFAPLDRDQDESSRRAERILKGFGGCKFTRRYGWDCVGCGKTEMFPGLDPRGWVSKHCVFCQRTTYHDVREVVEVKKIARAIRQGFTRRENVAARP
jgi:hypothetical protein